MTLAELIAALRTDADDLVANPYLWSDAELTRWANEAEQEAALRAKLLFDASTTAVCQIAVLAGTTSYALHAKVQDAKGLFGIFKKPWNDRELLARVAVLTQLRPRS